MTDHADGRSGAMLHSIAVEDPATVAVDARAGRVVVMNQDGSVSGLDARTDAPLHGTLVSSAPGGPWRWTPCSCHISRCMTAAM
jgi:hypothetical protein